jgi:hypothetical protein
VKRDEEGRIIEAGGTGEGEGQDGGGDAAVESALLHFSSPRDAATIAAFLRTRVYRPESLVWLEGYKALLRWRKENRITDLCAVPYDTEVELGVIVFPLGRWVHEQRKALRTGLLDDHRKELRISTSFSRWLIGSSRSIANAFVTPRYASLSSTTDHHAATTANRARGRLR